MLPLHFDRATPSRYGFSVDFAPDMRVENSGTVDTFTPLPDQLSVDYNFFERIFRVCVFQYTVHHVGLLEQLLIYLYRAISRCTFYPPAFDGERVNRSLDVFKQMGGEEDFVVPDDGHAKIHMMVLTADALKARIREKGGTWERIGNVLAITPPDVPNEEWEAFQNECLLHKTGWKWALVAGKRRIVTCEHADLVTNERFCALHVHSPGGPFVREKERVGFWLGMEKDICLFDPRCYPGSNGISKSEGVPSEKGYYLDGKAVLETVMRKQGLAPHQMWVSGTCGGGPVAAYMKSLYHEQGINFIAEQSFVSLEQDMLENKDFFVQWLARLGLSGLTCRDIDNRIGPQEDNFDTGKKWAHLPFSHRGKCIIIHADHDETLSEGAEERYLALAQTVNQHVVKMSFSAPPDVNGHNELCLRDTKMVRPLMETIFRQ